MPKISHSWIVKWLPLIKSKFWFSEIQVRVTADYFFYLNFMDVYSFAKCTQLVDSGVGKSSLTHLIAHKEPISKTSWTVGCSVEVKLHEYKEGTPQQKSYFIELWDVGGSSSHRNTRHVFYLGVHGMLMNICGSLLAISKQTSMILDLILLISGVILVHDLTNRKSQENLYKWLAEVFNRDSAAKPKKNDEYDAEQFVGYSQVLFVAPISNLNTKELT